MSPRVSAVQHCWPGNENPNLCVSAAVWGHHGYLDGLIHTVTLHQVPTKIKLSRESNFNLLLLFALTCFLNTFFFFFVRTDQFRIALMLLDSI